MSHYLGPLVCVIVSSVACYYCGYSQGHVTGYERGYDWGSYKCANIILLDDDHAENDHQRKLVSFRQRFQRKE